MIAGLPSVGINVLDVKAVPLPVARYYTRASDAVGGVHVRVSPHGEGLQLEICDNGIGSSVESHVPGRGLRNMQARAQMLGGRLYRIPSAPHGCTVRLDVPSFKAH